MIDDNGQSMPQASEDDTQDMDDMQKGGAAEVVDTDLEDTGLDDTEESTTTENTTTEE